MITFLRHSKLTLPYRDHSEMPFEILSQLGTGELNPPIDAEYTAVRLEELRTQLDFGSARVFASPSERCQVTARTISATFETLPALREVGFDLAAMDTDGSIRAAFEKDGIAVVNSAVFNGMLSGSCEPIAHVYERVREVLKAVPADANTICITHDFFMRVVEIFVRRKGAAFSPISLTELEATERNGYLSGFTADADFSALNRV